MALPFKRRPHCPTVLATSGSCNVVRSEVLNQSCLGADRVCYTVVAGLQDVVTMPVHSLSMSAASKRVSVGLINRRTFVIVKSFLLGENDYDSCSTGDISSERLDIICDALKYLIQSRLKLSFRYSAYCQRVILPQIYVFSY
jgi:hypothetical protein